MTITTLRKSVPAELLDISGHVPYTGKEGFTHPVAPVYFLGLNPGADPENGYDHLTIGQSLDVVWGCSKPFSEYLDGEWQGRPPLSHPMQRRMAHVFGRLGIDLRRIPASNLLFPRSGRAIRFSYDPEQVEELCWPFHDAVIHGLAIRTVIVAHSRAGERVRRRLGAAKLLERWEEANSRRWSFFAHEAGNGLRVLTITHPSVADWTAEPTDPTDFILNFMVGHY